MCSFSHNYKKRNISHTFFLVQMYLLTIIIVILQLIFFFFQVSLISLFTRVGYSLYMSSFLCTLNLRTLSILKLYLRERRK
ncbi:hypothetical protein AB205_0092650 [Aquarana catesbeiana]|uniref:Uncharacterized protein n=1 Tax=Aquarana catesbeiana TaxID=8400 RepID=A0A2G9R7I3_AQUCT|nr:hypothetical protein AB205_0092650 [Aquarana catesbeiana]